MFLIIWSVGVAYGILGVTLAFRLQWLRRSSRAPDAPTVDELLPLLGLNLSPWFDLLFSSRHKSFGDPVASGLIFATRALLVVALGGLLVFAAVISLRLWLR